MLVIAVAIATYFPMKSYLRTSTIPEDQTLAGNISLVLVFVALIVCIGIFLFNYKSIKTAQQSTRLIAYFITGLLLYVLAIALMIISTLWGVLIGNIFLFNGLLTLLFLGCMSYDYWNLLRKV